MTIIDIADPTGSPTTESTDDTSVVALPALKGEFTVAGLKKGVTVAKAKKRMAREPKGGTLSVLTAISQGDFDAPAKAIKAKAAKEPKAPRTSKGADVIALLEDNTDGVATADLITLTGWLPHTLRAFLSGLRKKGHEVIRDKHPERGTIYRIAKKPA